MIEQAENATPAFRKAAGEFLKHAQEAINPSLTDAEVREMLIQHILTGEVLAAVFPGTTFHEDNSVARELHTLEATFFTGNTKHQTLAGLAPYYTAIRLDADSGVRSAASARAANVRFEFVLSLLIESVAPQ